MIRKTETELPPHIARSLLTLRAADDYMRPRYHFAPPGGWMNDPNAPLWYHGSYHLFYQHNPYKDSHGSIHWGHCRSDDLLRFEDLSIALEPLPELHELGCWSGSGAIPFSGPPVLLYTGASSLPQAHNPQNAAIADSSLSRFPTRLFNILPLPPFEIRPDWRDPFFFHHEGRTFVVISAMRQNRAVLLLYEAVDTGLQRYSYVSELYSFAPDEMAFAECPNFFHLDGKWVLIVSPLRAVEYWIGDFDIARGRFLPEHHGILDTDNNHQNGLYATNIMCCWGTASRPILLGWLRGYPPGKGWCGALSLPRVLRLGGKNRSRLIQNPWPLTRKLRRDEYRLNTRDTDNSIYAGLSFELHCTVDPESNCTIDLGAPPEACYRIRMDEHGIRIGREDHIAFSSAAQLQSVRIFRDGMTLEIFINNGEQVVSRTLHPIFRSGLVRVRRSPGQSAVLWQLEP